MYYKRQGINLQRFYLTNRGECSIRLLKMKPRMFFNMDSRDRRLLTTTVTVGIITGLTYTGLMG